jgi:hypothetical protein
MASSCVFSLAHQATGGCYASTVKPFQVTLVKPVVYLKTELERSENNHNSCIWPWLHSLKRGVVLTEDVLGNIILVGIHK